MSETVDIPQDLDQERVVPAEALEALLVKMFVKKGMFKVDANVGAARLVEADLRGIHSHGSRLAPKYLEAMDAGSIDARAQVLTVQETPAIALLDGGMGLGHVAATKGMALAIEKAKEVGTGTVAVRRTQHLGAASLYSLMAAEAGMIGYTTTNTGPASVAAYGSKQPATANNAFAWSIPLRAQAPFVLDMACAVSSWGKVWTLSHYGEPIPAGWAYDEQGNETTDGFAAKTLLPAAGARGYGLAFISSVLSGVLAGGLMPIHRTSNFVAEGSEHFFYAIDVARFGDIDKFYDELESTVAEIRALEPDTGFDQVRLPGELEAARAQKWRETGIPLHKGPFEKLEEVAREMKIELPW